MTVLDEYGYLSQQKAIAATKEGAFDKEIVPIQVTLPDGTTEWHKVDEGIRFDVTLEGIKAVKLLQEGGAVTAATASQICDGASGVMVVNEAGLKQLGVKPLARIHSMTVSAGDPVIMLEEPLFCTDKGLKRAGMKIDDIDLFEVNEAFAPVPLAWLKHTGADPKRLNVNGGAIALGPSPRRLRHQADDHPRPRPARPRQALRPADDVRRRRHGQRHHRRAPLTCTSILRSPPSSPAARPVSARPPRAS